MTIIRNARTALNDLESIIDLTIIDFDYYEELRMLGINEKNARIRATIRGLLKQEFYFDNDQNKDTYKTFEIFSDLMFDEICLIKENQHSASFKTHDFYTRLLHNTAFTDELYEKFGCYFVLETSDINNISDVQIKYEFERRFGKPEEIDLALDDNDDLDLYDEDDLDLDLDDDLDLDSDDDLGLDSEDAKQKKLQATSDLVDDRPFCDVALLDYDYCISCLKVVQEHHKDGQMVKIPMCFFPFYDFELDTTNDYKEATLEKVLERLQNVRLIERELIDSEWHYALTEQGESELVLAIGTQTKNVGVIYFRDNNTFQPIVKHEYKKGDVHFYINGKAFSFESYDEIFKIIVMLDEAQQQGLTRVEINAVDIYVGALSNHLKSHYIDSKVIEDKFINFIKEKLGDKKERQITLSTFADALTFGSIDKTNKVLRRLLKKKMIKRRQKIEGSAYTYSLGKGEKLDFNIDF